MLTVLTTFCRAGLTTTMFTSVGVTEAGHGSGAEANIMCEKQLAFDHFVCLDLSKLAAAGDLTEVADVDDTVRLDTTSLGFINPSNCIQYCRGLDYTYALVQELSCQCATGIKVNLET